MKFLIFIALTIIMFLTADFKGIIGFLNEALITKERGYLLEIKENSIVILDIQNKEKEIAFEKTISPQCKLRSQVEITIQNNKITKFKCLNSKQK